MSIRKSTRRSKRFWLMASLMAAALLTPRVASAQTATVTGRVVDAQSGAPVTSAQVMVVGSSIGTAVDNDGRFRLTGVPVSARQIRVRGIGYQPNTTSLNLMSGGTVDLRIAMSASATSLDAMVITGTIGDTRRRAIGNAVSTVNVGDVLARSTVNNITEVLQSKTPGLTLMPGSGSAGTSTNYRLRGAGSLYAGNTPTIYLDGVRVNERNQGNFTVFGQTASSLDAINPNDIESIEIIKGPAAATLYGAEAAAGVIQIITKRGHPGKTRWETRFEAGSVEWDDDLKPVNYGVATAARIADTTSFPGYKGLQVGDIISHRAMTEPNALRTGGLSKLSISAAGGGDRYNYFVSAAQSKEEGVNLNNYSNLGSVRGNFSFIPSDKLNFSTNIDISRSHIRLPLNDNIAFGLIISSYLAIPGRKYAYPAGLNESQILPEVANTYDNQTRADRYIIGTTAEYKPLDWLTTRVRVGVDQNIGRAELYFSPQPAGLNPFSARASFELDNTKGFLAQGRPLSQNLTVNYDASATRQISTNVTSNTSVGAQYLANTYRRTLPPHRRVRTGPWRKRNQIDQRRGSHHEQRGILGAEIARALRAGAGWMAGSTFPDGSRSDGQQFRVRLGAQPCVLSQGGGFLCDFRRAVLSRSIRKQPQASSRVGSGRQLARTILCTSELQGLRRYLSDDHSIGSQVRLCGKPEPEARERKRNRSGIRGGIVQ
jgi:TonB-dependent starch-binding outer membrane protein SusC